LRTNRLSLQRGILPVLQTPFAGDGRVDFESLGRLIDDTIQAGAIGVLAPAVASEVDYLSAEERRRLIRFVGQAVEGRVPFVVGASSRGAEGCREFARLAGEIGAAAYLVAVPDALYQRPAGIPEFFQAVASAASLPLIIQDLQWNGPGLTLDDLRLLVETIPTLSGIKVETVPAGPKYTQVREAFGDALYVCGGWAVPQMIEALDRGVDGMVPEAAMVRVYDAIFRLHESGLREEAVKLFRRLLPVVSFTNQEIRLSIAFFKALLVRKGVFRTEAMRWPGFQWDSYNRRISEELIEHCLALEGELAAGS
jgi:4-hydroxy-tetrahydrodipicolinate synthase